MINDHTYDLRGRRYLVTGASSGIGRETAKLLTHRGAQVAVAGRDEERLSHTREELKGAEHTSYAQDLSAEGFDGDRWVRDIAADFGPLNGVVHCAGFHAARPIRTVGSDHIDHVFDVNVKVGFGLAKAFTRRRVRQDPCSLVFLSSIAGQIGQPALSVYSATKGAVDAMVRALAIELAPSVRLNAVAPGFVQTELADRFFATLSDEQCERIRQSHPLGLGEARDVAEAVAFLLSDASRWITGTSLVVDGGYTAQ